ncbi:outer membrane beta-barrel protein [Novosphingobium sp. NBM11]|uniref:outer membrane beta-barrel protein n=1 Tax=Novosphingobium sp. NBM11 TaxID=2596914 RepID=UPI0018922CA4|nr:outer membrane beta-barrel protein [Novosphingobium sp. NBM11]
MACHAPLARAQAFGELLDSEIPLSTKTGRNLGVLDRYFEKLEPQGIPAGGFRVYPSLVGAIGYTTNVVGAEQNPKSDFYAQVVPQIVAQSQWNRHSLRLTSYFDGRRYFRTPQKDQDGYLAQLDGRIDIVGQSKVELQAAQRRTYEDQTVGSFPANGGGAIAVDQTSALLRGTHVINRLRLTGSTDFNRLTYSDTVSTSGTLLRQGFRNRSVFRGSARLEYLLNAENAFFVQLTYRKTDYDDRSVANDRTSNEWRVLGGAIADATSLIRVALGVGYYRRTYQNPTFRTIGGVAVDARADYFVTTLTTVSLIASRKIEEATLANSSGYVATRGGFSIDHELLRNLRLKLAGEYQRDRFQNIDRRDSLFNASFGAEYRATRHWAFRPRIEYIRRESSGIDAGPDIREFRGLLSITLQQ